MIEKALRYLNSMVAPTIREIYGEQYSDKPLHRICHNPKAGKIEMNTLSSLVDYIESGVDEMKGNMIIHIQSPTRVELYSCLDGEREREHIAVVYARVPDFKFGQFMEHENFCINLQSKFIDDPNTDKELLLKFAGTVEAGSVAEYGDDGVTQKATVKTGITSKEDAVVPSPAFLIPYRTFIEAGQPGSQFIFRMKDGKYDGVQCALFEADGGAWEIEAMDNIRNYLETQLEGIENFIIIS